MYKGIFITIEGGDGSGKSTQVKNIKKYFEGKDYEVVYTREPGGTQIGEKIRDIILDKNNVEMDNMTEALLYAASRAQHVAQVIKPALEAGKVVICDRFIDSSIIYQGYGRQLGDCVTTINEFAVAGCMPDLTLVLLLDPAVGKNRIRADQQDRLELEKMEFHNRVYEGYQLLLEKYPERVVAINANTNIEAIRDEIFQEIDRVLETCRKYR